MGLFYAILNLSVIWSDKLKFAGSSNFYSIMTLGGTLGQKLWKIVFEYSFFKKIVTVILNISSHFIQNNWLLKIFEIQFRSTYGRFLVILAKCRQAGRIIPTLLKNFPMPIYEYLHLFGCNESFDGSWIFC